MEMKRIRSAPPSPQHKQSLTIVRDVCSAPPSPLNRLCYEELPSEKHDSLFSFLTAADNLYNIVNSQDSLTTSLSIFSFNSQEILSTNNSDIGKEITKKTKRI